MKTFKRTCNKLNKILDNRPESQSEFIDTINEIIDNEVFQCGGDLYWNRELFIDCGTDDELCRKICNRRQKCKYLERYIDTLNR